MRGVCVGWLHAREPDQPPQQPGHSHPLVAHKAGGGAHARGGVRSSLSPLPRAVTVSNTRSLAPTCAVSFSARSSSSTWALAASAAVACFFTFATSACSASSAARICERE